MQSKIKQSNWFDNKNIYVGLDVHKKKWTVSVYSGEFEHKTFIQPPKAEAPYSYLIKNFPGAQYYSACEAGFCGYTPHRKLCELGIENIVINSADIPSGFKKKYVKTDHIDSRKIARDLRSGSLRGIHVFDPIHEELRTLSRIRLKLVRDQRKCKNRIKSFLMYYSINIPEEYDNNNWSHSFLNWMKELNMNSEAGKIGLNVLLDDYQTKHVQLLDVTKKLKRLMKQGDNTLFYRLNH